MDGEVTPGTASSMRSLTISFTVDYVETHDRSGRCYCGADFCGTLEAFETSIAYGALRADGEVDHDGWTDTECIWNSQWTVETEDGRAIFVCLDGHHYVMPHVVSEAA